MKNTTGLLSIIIVLALLTSCAPVPTLVPTDMPAAIFTPPPTVTPTPEPEPTPTAKVEVPLEQLPATIAAATEFVYAMTTAGISITPEQVLQQGLTIKELTGKDGEKYEVASTQDGYPLMIKGEGEDWKELGIKEIAQYKGLYVQFSTSVMNKTGDRAMETATQNGNGMFIADALWKIPYSAIDSTMPSANKINLDAMNKAINNANNISLPPTVAHLLWGAPYTLPDWLLNGNYSKEQLLAIQTSYLQKVIGDNKGKVYAWIVINEPYGGAGQEAFWNAQFENSDDWIINAFKTARKADPGAKLILNDFGQEIPGSWLFSQQPQKNDRLLEVAEQLKNDGVNIEVGFQMHLIGKEYMSDTDLTRLVDNFKNNVSLYRERNIPVVITEMDVNMEEVPIDQQPMLLSKIYYRFLRAAIEVGITDIDFFGYEDSQSWYETSQGLKNANPTLFDTNGKKIAYYGALKAMVDAVK